MAKVIARVSGIALKPGISKNRRLYTREAVAGMVTDAQDRIQSGGGLTLTDRTPPDGDVLTQKTHHGANDDSTRVIGRITGMSLDENGNARFTADLADTPHGRTIASLLDTSDGTPPFLKGVSIRGAWTGNIRQIPGSDGEPLSTGDGLQLRGLDYTGTPGVPGAQVDGFEWAAATPPQRPGETADGRELIYESVTEALVTAITEETTAAEVTPPATETTAGPAGISEALTGEVRAALRALLPWEASPALSKRDSGLAGAGRVWADPGYQSDKKQRYDLSTKANSKSAWSFINQADNAKAYTPAQLKRVKGRIIKALKGFGVTVAAEGWVIEPAFQVTEALAEYMGSDPSMAGSWSVCASNGPVSMQLSSYCMDPADLGVILRAAADAAGKALAALDPDMDGDVDVPGVGDGSDTDGDAGETAPVPAAVTPAEREDPEEEPVTETGTEDPATTPAAATKEEEEPAMSEPTPQETAAGQAPAATPTAPAGNTVTVDRSALESMLAEAVAAGRRQGKKERKAAEAAAALAAAVSAATPAAPAAATETAPPAPAAVPAAPVVPVVAEASDEDTARLVREGVAARLAAEGITAAPAVQESREQAIRRLVDEEYVKAKQDLVASGRIVVQRTGLSVDGAVDEHRTPPAVPGTEAAQGVHPATGFPTTWPGGGAKQPHEWTSEELTKYGGATLDNYVMGSRAVLQMP